MLPRSLQLVWLQEAQVAVLLPSWKVGHLSQLRSQKKKKIVTYYFLPHLGSHWIASQRRSLYTFSCEPETKADKIKVSCLTPQARQMLPQNHCWGKALIVAQSWELWGHQLKTQICTAWPHSLRCLIFQERPKSMVVCRNISTHQDPSAHTHTHNVLANSPLFFFYWH